MEVLSRGHYGRGRSRNTGGEGVGGLGLILRCEGLRTRPEEVAQLVWHSFHVQDTGYSDFRGDSVPIQREVT